MASPNIRLLKLGFSGDSPSQVARVADVVIARIVSNDCKIPLDSNSIEIPTLPMLQAQCLKVTGAIRLPNGAPAKEARRSERDAMVGLLQKVGSFYEVAADGDRVLLATTGFELKKDPGGRTEGSTPVPTNFHVVQSTISRKAIGKTKIDKSVVNIESQWSLQSDPTSDQWHNNGLTTKSQNIEFNDLPRGVDLFFRCRAHGPNGASGWSDIATLMVI